MKVFIKVILLLFFFGFTLEDNGNACGLVEQCLIIQGELNEFEDSGMYHLKNFHRIDHAVLD
ncbi:hypothetical protein JYB62_01250 [Algoriphagus lutimaris]|uniref:hypothetical protein n=1 Tax=Algoriphagus lutimaris TaxID=613197 RepID=UPI00196A33CE|nr:hypothetical protein [Algoriphagus lutimaris]MBN3518613.1 hypothetical protein [Algoriphagus lutimaris]